MPTFLIVTAVVAAAFMAWFYVGLMRVHAGRAKTVVESTTPQRTVNRRLIRQTHRENGR